MSHDTDIAAELRSLAAYAYVGSYVRERLLRAADEIERLRAIVQVEIERDRRHQLACGVPPDRLPPDEAEEYVRSYWP